MKNLNNYSLAQVDSMYQNGALSTDEVTDYLRAWNAGPHFTQAVIWHGSIRQFDPETNHFYQQLYKTYGVRV
jgi:hypothetical protein